MQTAAGQEEEQENSVTDAEVWQAPLDVDNFSLVPAILGVVLVYGMQIIKERSVKNGN